jgi:hypothetical protein
VQYSTNLVFWEDLASVGSFSNLYEYLDEPAPGRPSRFYRIRD